MAGSWQPATATMRCAEPRREGDVYGSLDEQVARFGELAGPPIVVFQDLDDPPVAATFGEIMCTTYQAFGAVGLVTSGAARDVDQVRLSLESAYSGDQKWFADKLRRPHVSNARQRRHGECRDEHHHASA